MKCLFAVGAALAVVTSVYSAETNQVISAEQKAANKERFLTKSGGMIPNKTRGEGFVAVLNAQGKVSPEDVAKYALMIEDSVWLRTTPFNVAKASKFSDIGPIAKASKGNVSVMLAELDISEPLIVLPEYKTAVVNVSALAAGADEKKLASRVKKELIRAYCYAMQLQYPKAGGGLMDPEVSSVEELDKVLLETPDGAIRGSIDIAAERFGITRFSRITYRMACERGIAPPPQNKYQKAIWDHYHSLPTEPIKIAPETVPVK